MVVVMVVVGSGVWWCVVVVMCGVCVSICFYSSISVCVCCIGALIIKILISFHQEVVRCIKTLSRNPRNLYNTHTYIYTHMHTH